MNDPSSLNLEGPRARQQRLIEWMREHKLDLVVATSHANVQWLSGQYLRGLFQAAMAISVDGQTTLILPETVPLDGLTDNLLTYPAQLCATLRNDQADACQHLLAESLGNLGEARLGVEFSSFPQHLLRRLGITEAEAIEDVEPALYQLRRIKHADELAAIQVAIGATEQMYTRAREIIRPGISELEVFSELQAAAVQHCGEMLTATGNDYQCNSPGGPPRQGVLAEAGQLYILDLGPSYRGYFADNCRTIAVTDTTAEQREALTWIVRALELVEERVRPGASARQLYEDVRQLLEQAPIGEFFHHLGHGFGLYPHEAPHLNPNWDDTFQLGEVFTAEPGLYDPRLAAGMRIENNYLVTANGLQRLTNFSMEL